MGDPFFAFFDLVMILLSDTVIIRTTPTRAFQWFEHLEENYLAWHPAHVSCRYLQGAGLKEGSVLRVEEYLHGKLHKLTFHLTRVVPAREIQYRIAPGLRGGFRFKPTTEGVELGAEIRLGWQIPIMGVLVDLLLKVFFYRQLQALRQHMHEEGLNLRAILEQHTASVIHREDPQWLEQGAQ